MIQCSSVPDSPHLAQCPQGSWHKWQDGLWGWGWSWIMFLCTYIHHMFLIHPSIHPSLDTWVVSMSWCLWLMLRWTQGCRGLLKMLISFPLWISPEVELLHHTVIRFLVLWGTSVLFSIANEAMSILSSWMLLTTIPTVLRDQGQALKNLYVLSFIIFWQPSRKQWETEGEAKG